MHVCLNKNMLLSLVEIRNIWAIGRNYSEHAKELGNSVPETTPLVFLKAGSGLVFDGGLIRLPHFSSDIHHEVEVAYQVDTHLRPYHCTVAIDFTARDIQSELKKRGHPWTLAKSFKHSCAIGSFVSISSFDELKSLAFQLKINGEVRQTGNTKDMIFGFEQIHQYILERFPIVPGDLVLTGTPAGVSKVVPGDLLEAEITGKLKSSWTIKNA